MIDPDLAKAWSEGFTAATEYAVARQHWVFNGGDRPDRPECPYVSRVSRLSEVEINCAVAAQMFEQHRGR